MNNVKRVAKPSALSCNLISDISADRFSRRKNDPEPDSMAANLMEIQKNMIFQCEIRAAIPRTRSSRTEASVLMKPASCFIGFDRRVWCQNTEEAKTCHG